MEKELEFTPSIGEAVSFDFVLEVFFPENRSHFFETHVLPEESCNQEHNSNKYHAAQADRDELDSAGSEENGRTRENSLPGGDDATSTAASEKSSKVHLENLEEKVRLQSGDEYLEAFEDETTAELEKEGFIPIGKLSLAHLPSAIRADDTLTFIRDVARRVVRINNNALSSDRPTNFRFEGKRTLKGTGLLFFIEEDIAVVATNRHVLYDDDEVRSATIDMFYDVPMTEACRSGRMRRTTRGRGLGTIRTDQQHDFTLALFRLDRDVIEGMRTPSTREGALPFAELMSRQAFPLLTRQSVSMTATGEQPPAKIVCVISHPLGVAKQVSFGAVVAEDVKTREFSHSAPTRQGSSGAPVLTFSPQPPDVPPNSVWYHVGSASGNVKRAHLQIHDSQLFHVDLLDDERFTFDLLSSSLDFRLASRDLLVQWLVSGDFARTVSFASLANRILTLAAFLGTCSLRDRLGGRGLQEWARHFALPVQLAVQAQMATLGSRMPITLLADILATSQGACHCRPLVDGVTSSPDEGDVTDVALPPQTSPGCLRHHPTWPFDWQASQHCDKADEARGCIVEDLLVDLRKQDQLDKFVYLYLLMLLQRTANVLPASQPPTDDQDVPALRAATSRGSDGEHPREAGSSGEWKHAEEDPRVPEEGGEDLQGLKRVLDMLDFGLLMQDATAAHINMFGAKFLQLADDVLHQGEKSSSKHGEEKTGPDTSLPAGETSKPSSTREDASPDESSFTPARASDETKARPREDVATNVGRKSVPTGDPPTKGDRGSPREGLAASGERDEGQAEAPEAGNLLGELEDLRSLLAHSRRHYRQEQRAALRATEPGTQDSPSGCPGHGNCSCTRPDPRQLMEAAKHVRALLEAKAGRSRHHPDTRGGNVPGTSLGDLGQGDAKTDRNEEQGGGGSLPSQEDVGKSNSWSDQPKKTSDDEQDDCKEAGGNAEEEVHTGFQSLLGGSQPTGGVQPGLWGVLDRIKWQLIFALVSSFVVDTQAQSSHSDVDVPLTLFGETVKVLKASLTTMVTSMCFKQRKEAPAPPTDVNLPPEVTQAIRESLPEATRFGRRFLVANEIFLYDARLFLARRHRSLGCQCAAFPSLQLPGESREVESRHRGLAGYGSLTRLRSSSEELDSRRPARSELTSDVHPSTTTPSVSSQASASGVFPRRDTESAEDERHALGSPSLDNLQGMASLLGLNVESKTGPMVSLQNMLGALGLEAHKVTQFLDSLGGVASALGLNAEQLIGSLGTLLNPAPQTATEEDGSSSCRSSDK